jgi:agmatine deiminase
MFNTNAESYRMPGEFEPHRACWMAFPYRLDTWHDNAKPAQKAFSEVANAISSFETVYMCVKPELIETARQLLSSRVTIVPMDYDSEWMRDIGPTFVKNSEAKLGGIDWKFNSWGGIYESHEKDSQVAKHVLDYLSIEHSEVKLVLEGGSIHVDGQGTLITTEECLFHHNRNPDFTKKDYEKIFHEYLGVTKVIWIEKGVHNDPVDGHIDNLCCFVKPGVVLLAWTDDTADPQHAISQAAFTKLSSEKDAQGRNLEIIKLHQPKPLFITQEECNVEGDFFFKPGDRLPASYINFYIANDAVIMPTFDDPVNDPKAQKVLAEAFTSRKIIPVRERDIVAGGGGIHCITQQQPA